MNRMLVTFDEVLRIRDDKVRTQLLKFFGQGSNSGSYDYRAIEITINDSNKPRWKLLQFTAEELSKQIVPSDSRRYLSALSKVLVVDRLKRFENYIKEERL